MTAIVHSVRRWARSPAGMEALGSVVRWALGIVGTLAVQHGYVTTGTMTVLSALALSQWQKFAMRQKLVTAVSIAGTTEAVVEQQIAAGAPVPSVTTAKTIVPLPVTP